MKLLLTSSGIKNASIHDALVALLGKSLAESNALFIPTAIYPFAPGPLWPRRRSMEKWEGRCVSWVGSLWDYLSLPRCPALTKKRGYRQSKKPTRCFFGAAIRSSTNAEQWAARLPVPVYAIDDQTAIQVNDGNIDVISEGHWKLFHPLALPSQAARLAT